MLRVNPEGALSFVAELPGGGNGHLVWRDGAVFVTARQGHAVYRVTPDGTVQSVVGNGTKGTVDGAGQTAQLALPNGIALSPDGNALYVNDQPTPRTFQMRKIQLPPMDKPD